MDLELVLATAKKYCDAHPWWQGWPASRAIGYTLSGGEGEATTLVINTGVTRGEFLKEEMKMID